MIKEQLPNYIVDMRIVNEKLQIRCTNLSFPYEKGYWKILPKLKKIPMNIFNNRQIAFVLKIIVVSKLWKKWKTEDGKHRRLWKTYLRIIQASFPTMRAKWDYSYSINKTMLFIRHYIKIAGNDEFYFQRKNHGMHRRKNTAASSFEYHQEKRI